MTAFVTESPMEEARMARTAGTANLPAIPPVVAVVGFDGSGPAQRALDTAVRMLRDRPGRLEVVYVASLPAGVAMSADAIAESERTFDELERQLGDEVGARLAGTEARWHFQRRNGSVAHELMAFADDLRRRDGPDPTIVVVVGGSSHKYHRVFGAAPLGLVRHDRFPVVVVP